MSKQHSHFRLGGNCYFVHTTYFDPLMLPLCHKRVHPNPPVSLTISFTWGFLVECRQRLNILPAEIGARLSFLSKLPRESEKKKKDITHIFVISNLQIPAVHKRWCALQMKCTTLRHIYKGGGSVAETNSVNDYRNQPNAPVRRVYFINL